MKSEMHFVVQIMASTLLALRELTWSVNGQRAFPPDVAAQLTLAN